MRRQFPKEYEEIMRRMAAEEKEESAAAATAAAAASTEVGGGARAVGPASEAASLAPRPASHSRDLTDPASRYRAHLPTTTAASNKAVLRIPCS